MKVYLILYDFQRIPLIQTPIESGKFHAIILLGERKVSLLERRPRFKGVLRGGSTVYCVYCAATSSVAGLHSVPAWPDSEPTRDHTQLHGSGPPHCQCLVYCLPLTCVYVCEKYNIRAILLRKPAIFHWLRTVTFPLNAYFTALPGLYT